MLVTTLDRMARGGLMDQLAGGFHRYSTDEAWLVPHFEKMLYDNASLAWLYAEASALAPGAGFDRVARFTLDFVLREMTGPEGGFLSAIDAETDGHEGAYYTWTAEELEAALPGPEGRLFRAVYGLEGPPPFEGERYVLFLHTPSRRAGARGRALGSRPDAAARAGPARARRGPLAPRAPAHRRQGARRLERPDDRRNGARGGAPRRAALHRGGRARRRLRALADGGRGGGHAAPRLPRRQGARCGLPRRLRVPRGGAPPAARGDGGRAVADRGGAPG